MAKIYLDAGHGGSDPGATGNGLREKDLTLKIAKYTRDYLLANYDKVQVRLSRETDKTLSLRERTNDANKWKADSLTSIHVNAATSKSATGYEDFIYNRAIRSTTRKLQNTIHEEMKKVFKGFRNRGKKRANFHMLRESNMSACLPEFLFITNKNDAAFLKKDSNLKLIGKHLAIALAKYHGLKKKPKKTTAKPKITGKMYYVQVGAFRNKKNADVLFKKVKNDGFDAYIKVEGGLYKVQLGAFSVRKNADSLAAKAKKKGYSVYITN